MILHGKRNNYTDPTTMPAITPAPKLGDSLYPDRGIPTSVLLEVLKASGHSAYDTEQLCRS